MKRGELDELRNQKNLIIEQIGRIEGEMSSIHSVKGKLIEQIEETCSELNISIPSSSKSTEDFIESTSKFKKWSKNVEKNVKEREEEVNNEKEEMRRLEEEEMTKLANMRAELNEISSKVSSLESSLATLTSELSSINSKLSSLSSSSSSSDGLKREIDEIQDRLSSNCGDEVLNEVREEIDDLENQIEVLESQHKKLDKSRQEMGEIIQSEMLYEKQKEELEKETSQLIEELEEIANPMKELVEQSFIQIDELNNEEEEERLELPFSHGDDVIGNFEKVSNFVSQPYEILSNLLDDVKGQKITLETSYSHQASTIESLQSDNEDLIKNIKKSLKKLKVTFSEDYLSNDSSQLLQIMFEELQDQVNNLLLSDQYSDILNLEREVKEEDEEEEERKGGENIGMGEVWDVRHGIDRLDSLIKKLMDEANETLTSKFLKLFFFKSCFYFIYFM